MANFFAVGPGEDFGPKGEIALGIFVLAFGIVIIAWSAITGGTGGVLIGGFTSLIGVFFIGVGIRRLNREAAQVRAAEPGDRSAGDR